VRTTVFCHLSSVICHLERQPGERP
jgi:hypothetical protein